MTSPVSRYVQRSVIFNHLLTSHARLKARWSTTPSSASSTTPKKRSQPYPLFWRTKPFSSSMNLSSLRSKVSTSPAATPTSEKNT